MMVLQWCIDIFNVIVEVWLGYWLFNVPKYRRFEQKWVRILEYGCFIGLPSWNVLYDRMLGMRFSNIQTLTLTSFVFISMCIFCRRNIMCCLALSAIYYCTISLIELPGIVLSGWLMKQPYVNFIWQISIYDYLYLIILSASLLLAYKKWNNIIRNTVDNIITSYNALLWIVFAAIEWWIITYFLSVGHTESGRDVFIYNIISIVLVLMLLLVFSALVIYRSTECLRHERQLEEERLERTYEIIKNEYQRKTRELHDMKHRLQPIEGYLSSERPDKALVYVRELLGDISKSQNRIHGWTGNPLIDSFLDRKAEIARRKNIDFHINVSLLNVTLSDKDTSVLLGNLLDNAIEAASLCINKWVEVNIIQKGNIFIIRVKNTYSISPVEVHGRFESTKIDKKSHGWGIENVRTIVEKNGGEMKIQYDNQYFEVTIIFLEKKEANSNE